MKQSEFPEWAQKIKEESNGNVLRMSGGKIYLYRSTSRRIPGHKYPVAKEEYLGVVTPTGLLPADSFQFFPLMTEVGYLKEIFPLEYDNDDLAIINRVVVINKSGRWMLPKISEDEEATIRKYMNIEKGEVQFR